MAAPASTPLADLVGTTEAAILQASLGAYLGRRRGRRCLASITYNLKLDRGRLEEGFCRRLNGQWAVEGGPSAVGAL